MKAAFFSLATMAISAFAAPLTDNKVERAMDAAVPVLEFREVLVPEKRTIRASADLIVSLQGCVDSVNQLTVNIDASVGKVGKGSGKISADDCVKESLPHIQSIAGIIGDVHASIQAAGGLKITAKGDLQIILDLLVKLITGVTVCFKNLALTVGLRAELSAALKLAFGNLGNLLGHTCARGPGLAYGSIQALGNFFVGIRAGILAPCLGATFGAAGGLRAGLGLFGGINFGVGAGVSVSAGLAAGLGLGVGAGAGAGAGFGAGIGAGAGVGIGAN